MNTRIVAGAVVLAMLTSACSETDLGAQPAPDGSSAAPVPTVSTEIVQIDDGLHRYVVTTVSSPANGMLRVASPADAGSAAASGLSGELVVRSGTAQQVIEFEAGDLEAVAAPVDEHVLVDEARRVGMVAFVVVDVAGRAGSAGARYLSIDGELELTGPGADPAGAADEASRSDADISAAIRTIDSVVTAETIAPGVIAVASSEPLSDLTAVDGVVAAEPEVMFGVTDDPAQSTQWALRNTGDPAQAGGWPGTEGVDTGAPYAWDVATGADTVVAVIDSGVQLDHPDLASQIATNGSDPCGDGIDGDRNGFVDDCRGWDFGDGDNDPSPSLSASNHAHGTHVAGIVAAARNGVGTVGIAPDARVLPIKVGRSDGAITMSGLVAAIHYAADRDVDVINLSLSTGPGVSRSAVGALESAIAYAGSRGVLVVAASGNNGVDITANSAWPASFSDLYPFVLTVGALTNAGGRASFSNHGSPIDVMAPGWWVYAPWVGGGYTFQSGTSMAAPAVAGAAAVLLSHVDRPPAELRAAIVATGAPSPSGPMLDVAAGVGQSRDGAWNVTYTGADTVRADEAGGFSMEVEGRVDGAAGVRLSVATLDQGQVAAVGDLTAQIRVQDEPSSVTTDAAGAFPVLPITGDLVTGETYVMEWLTLPAGSYALVTELVSTSGSRVGSPLVVYLAVSPGATAVTTTTTPTTTPTIAPTIAPTTTTASTTPPPGAPSGPTTPTPPSGAGGGSGTGGGSVTTTVAPPATPAPTPTQTSTTVPGGSPASPSTTVAGGTASPTSSTSTSTVAPRTGGEPGPSTTAPPTGGGTGGGGGSTPVTTTPRPDPVREGTWALTGMDPRAGHIDGGTRVTITGTFPTWVPVYVWFGDVAVVRAETSGDSLVVTTPAVVAPMVVDVTVRFRTATSVEMTLTDAFTYHGTPTTGGPGTTQTTAAPTTIAGGGSDGIVTTTTPPGNTPPTVGSTTTTIAVTPTTSPTTTIAPPRTTAPTATSTTVAGGTDGDGSWVRSRGSLTLRAVSPGSSLGGLSASRWPSAGCAAACTATTL